MCGVFYVDDETAREIERTIRMVDEKLKMKRRTGDIRPTDIAAVISADKKGLGLLSKKWGFPGFEKQKVIINARAETALEKRIFRDSVWNRRIVIPATGFYEWNDQKEKATFTPMTQSNGSLSILYMAGFFNYFEGEDRFVILTTEANASMRDTHSRMPLILEREELEEWLCNDRSVEMLLHKEPSPLLKSMEYEQQRLIF